MEHSLDNDELRTWYRQRGFGARVGFGEKPGLIVIDMAKRWLDPDQRVGSAQGAVLEQVLTILAAARTAAIPIAFTTVRIGADFGDTARTLIRKLPHWAEYDLAATELDPTLERRPDEPLVVKPRQSAFYGTPLLTYLIAENVDTLVIVGLSTSGCIRSTCDEAFNYGYRVIVPREAVGDRSPSAHEANLFDIDNRFGDVTTTEAVVAHLATVRRAVNESCKTGLSPHGTQEGSI